MEYKYKKGQLFKKRLNVPKDILNKIYNSALSLEEYLNYSLEDKIPTSCIIEYDKNIIDKFGIDKCRNLDWELINKNIFYDSTIDLRELLMEMDTNTENINNALYEIIKDKIKPNDYSKRMMELYPNKIFKTDEYPTDKKFMIDRFNNGMINLKEIISNWDIFRNKDLSYPLLHDNENKNNITNDTLKTFMSKYEILIPLFIKTENIYEIIPAISNDSEYIKKITDKILDNAYEKKEYKFTNDEYKELFKYSSLEAYLNKFDNWNAESLINELKELPQNYIFNIPIPFFELLNYNVLTFIRIYGLKNIVDFDNECGHFFTNDDCLMLKLMNNMYLHYAGNEHDPNKTIYTKNPFDENGKYVERLYTKDEFYEAMRRMIIYGPSDWNLIDKAPDYRKMTGEFRTRNADLFLDEEAEEELKKLFYTKSITPNLLVNHPEYIKYLNGKDLSSCLKDREIKVNGSESIFNYQNIYKFLSSKTDFNNTMNFITEYSDVLDIIFDRKILNDYNYEMELDINDSLKEIENKINMQLRKILIEKNIIYPKIIPKSLKENYPKMFLDDLAPKELQESFYNRNISIDFIMSNPSYIDFLKKVDLEIIFKYMPINIASNNGKTNFVNCIQKVFNKDDAFDVMLLYGKYIEEVFKSNKLEHFNFNINFDKNDLLNEMDKVIKENIINGKMRYSENMPEHFKNNNPTLFLDNADNKIKDKFYNRKFTLIDFDNDPTLFNLFVNTNIACGFNENMAWIIPLFNNMDNKIANYNRLKLISAYDKIQDVLLQNAFKDYVMEFKENIDIEKIEYVSEVLKRLSLSNSSEIFTFRKELATQILKSNNPLESLNKIEDVFIRNNIPTVGKIYSCFEILHPNFEGFNMDGSTISPILKKSSNTSRKIIVFSDLIKSSFGSNNRSVNSYLKNIELGSNLYEGIKNNEIEIDFLDEWQKKELITFSKHLATLYNNTASVKKNNDTYITTGNILEDIYELSKKLSPDGTLNYNIADRVTRMFCGFAGIDTLEQAKEYINEKVKTADLRNRIASSSDMTLEQGDFIKGIGGITYLRNILQNGSVSKEYLGSSAGSDATPLDTDISMILSSDGTVSEKIEETAAKDYGPIWFVLKNDDRFITTRTSNELLEQKRDISKMEVFYTGVLGQGHYGIRTGFASSEINYIVMDNYDPKVGLEIAMNGFYIPVANKDGKIIFTPKDYDELRTKMNGLSYFEEYNYNFSENLITEETKYLADQIEKNNLEVQVKREKISSVLKDAMEELGLHLKTNIDGDLTEGFVELIDTGSTGRGTNKPGDGDFDFMMRLDKTILSNPTKLNELKETILKTIGKENPILITGTGDFRLKNVQIDTDINVDLDITFTEKTDKVLYSTDMALSDRLETIKKCDKEKYKYVIANILLAKQVLKDAEVYKPNRGDIPQGGLGGVGIENWILQNGGSFIDAARSFIIAADGKSFKEFQSTYQIWDFGDNHLAERRGMYAHDNFVTNNMSEAGYEKMIKVLKEYILNIENKEIKKENIK